MSPKTIQSIGEFGLIEQIKKWIPLCHQGRGRGERGRICGIGDDAAVFPVGSEKNQLFTVDTLVEGVDFIKTKATPFQIGWKALAINLSDIAAMGGTPTIAVISLILPPRTTLKFVEGFYEGVRTCAQKFKVSIVGGDLSKGPVISSTVALLGESHPKQTIYRSGAKVGDFICVTGRLGGSILKKHLNFTPRVWEGQFLAKRGISSMIDISDGLKQDLKHVTDSSAVAAVIDERKIPVSKAALKLAGGKNQKALNHALTDGEDFELLFTIAQERLLGLEKQWKKRFRLQFTQIGRIVDRSHGALEMRRRLGFQHF